MYLCTECLYSMYVMVLYVFVYLFMYTVFKYVC